MRIIRTVAEMREVAVSAVRPLGLVPTMGAVHAGHIALMNRARRESDTVVTSLFVNPTQFDDHDDFEDYARDLERDLAQFEASGTDVAFTPSVDEMYPPGFSTSISVGSVADRLEGAARLGHFAGVATVVCKLFAAVRPDRAYLGQKDAQQCAVIRRLNADLNLGAEIVIVPTVRDSDGLALSSRNQRLSASERKSAQSLYAALRLAQRLWSEGTSDAAKVKASMLELITAQDGLCVDYVSIADPDSFEELEAVERSAVVAVAARVGKTRLIDNLVLK